MTSCCQGLIDDSILFSQLRFFCSTVEHAFVAIDPIAINPPKNEMRAVGMESNEEGEIPLIQEPPLKKTKLLLWLAGGESDGKNTHLITHTHTLMGEMLTWRFGMSARGVLCFNSLEATQDAVSFMPWQVVC